MAQHHPLHPSACFRSDPRSLPSKADEFGACSLLMAQALRRSKGSRNNLISFPLIFFSPFLHLQRQEEKIQPHTHVPFSWTRELVGGQPRAQRDLHSHKHSLSALVLPQEWRSCSCTDSPPLPGEGGRKPSRASVRNGPMYPDFICASEPGEESLQPGGARGTEPPSFARALQVQRHPLATVT